MRKSDMEIVGNIHLRRRTDEKKSSYSKHNQKE